MEKFVCLFVSLLFAASALAADQCNNLAVQQALRPCDPYNNNWNCIRAYFAGSSCNLQSRVQIPDVLSVTSDLLVYPVLNLTGHQRNIEISGVSSGQVVSFIVDYQTDVMQLTTRFTGLTIRSDTILNYLQPNQEPIRVNLPRTSVEYDELFLITVFNSATKPDLRNSFTLANTATTASYDLGVCSSPAANQPPILQRLLQEFIRRSDVDGPEGLLVRSPIVSVNFIQEAFCDFGIDVSNTPVPLGTID